MPFRQRAILACGVLILVPTAIWAIRGENPFLLGASNRAEAGAAVIYVPEASHGFGHHGHGPDGAMAGYFEPGDHTGHGRAHAHPHGNQLCASGCAASNSPTPPLTLKEFKRLMALYANEPLAADSEQPTALDHLLYYGRQALLYLDREGHAPLDDERAAFLRRELKRTHVLVHFRMVDEQGVTRVSMPPTRVPLDIRHEFVMDTHDLPPVEISGTVKRTKLHHLWQRL